MVEKSFTADRLQVEIHPDARAMGMAAAGKVRTAMLALLATKPGISMLFAAAPSQNTTLEALLEFDDIPWERVTAFHMDEYVGIQESAPQAFRSYLHAHLFAHKPFKAVHVIKGEAKDANAEAERYAALLRSHGLDLVLLGIGENGHIAFNDPPDARFDEPTWTKVVRLSEASRVQQVHDGCFERLELVPERAITVTIPAFMAARSLCCVVPYTRKAVAVERTVNGAVTPYCPASILRTHPDATLFLDEESAALL